MRKLAWSGSLLFSALLLGAACGGDDDGGGADGGGGGGCEDAVAGEADECCPEGANANTDPDCDAECGNAAVEEGEQCDDGGTTPGDGCDGLCQGEPTAYRVDSLELRDPHLFALGAVDVTETVNGQIMAALVADDPPNGKLDLSLLVVFRPALPDTASNDADAILGAGCTVPAETTTCTVDPESTVVSTTATNGDGDCLAPVADSTGGYSPAITTPGGRCFATAPEEIEVTAAGVVLRLQDAQVGATWGNGAPPADLTEGLFFGFMTEADADATTIPEDTPVVGGEPLSSLLKESDKDIGPGGESGWYFYFNFTAAPVPFTEGQ